MLAVHGVDVVRQEPAIGTFEADLVGTENRLQQPQEQPDPTNMMTTASSRPAAREA